jgi:universal stress protein A
MPNYKIVLVATDLQAEYSSVLKKAIEIAGQYQAALHVISVVPELPFYMAEGGVSSLVEIRERYDKDIKNRIIQAQASLKIQAEFVVKHGTPKSEIIKYADHIRADLIILGSHKHTDVNMMLGSTAHAVLNRADCDILVIRVNSAS